MDVSHLLFDRPWQFNVDTVYKGRDNMYKIQQKSKKVGLVSLTNKKMNLEAKEKNFLTIVKGLLKEDFDGCKKLHKKDEFKMKSIFEEV